MTNAVLTARARAWDLLEMKGLKSELQGS